MVPLRPMPPLSAPGAFRRGGLAVLLSAAFSLAASAGSNPVRIDCLAGLDEHAASPSRRQAALARLTFPLDAQDLRRVLDWLADPSDPLAPMAAAALRNDAVNRLMAGMPVSDALAETLMTAQADPLHSAIWRDYCLQHLGSLLPALAPDKASRARALLWSALDDRSGAIAGTALIALHRNLGEGVPAGRLMDRAADIATDPSRGGGSRATALRLLAEHEDPRARAPALEALAQSRDVVLRMAAMATIADLGRPDDRSILESYETNPVPTLRMAALASIRRMDQRMASQGE